MGLQPQQIEAAVHRLVNDYRARCLWFLRADYFPQEMEEILRTLDYIDRHGDRAAFLRTAEIRRWLSPSSSERSAGS